MVDPQPKCPPNLNSAPAAFLVAQEESSMLHGQVLDQVVEVVVTHGTRLLRTRERCRALALMNAVVPFALVNAVVPFALGSSPALVNVVGSSPALVNVVGSSLALVVAALALLVPEEESSMLLSMFK